MTTTSDSGTHIADFFMTVSQVLTGSGGWPLNIFMTPDKRSFFAMTYLPKQGRDGMSGLMELLANIATLWRQQPDRIEKNCSGIMEALNLLSLSASQECVELEEIGHSAFEQLEQTYDSEYRGFGTAPKFPMPINISWLIEQGDAGNQQALKMALDTLRSIRLGGIWDQVGGGLHRYVVDREWLVPHFEKMLYDQAMVALDSSWLEQALQLTDEMTHLFYAPGTQTFAKTGQDAEQMPLAASLEHDGVLPSPFSLAAKCFIRLGRAADRPELHGLAHALLAPQLADSSKHPTAHLGALQAGVMLDDEAVVIQLEGRRDSSRVRELLRAAKSVLVPGLTIRFQASDHIGQAQLCAQGTCFPPVSYGDELTKLLALLR